MYLMEIDKIYIFKFIPGYESLDGVYKVVQKLTFDEILSTGVDMMAGFYSLVEKDDSVYEADRVDFKNEVFLKLLKPSDVSLETSAIWVPTSKLKEYPNPNVKEYDRLSAVIDLDVFESAQDISVLQTMIYDLIHFRFGIETTVDVVKYDSVWYTNEMYDDLMAEREQHKADMDNPIVQVNELNAELTEARARIAALEEILKQV